MENDFLDQIKGELTEYGKSLGKVGELRLVGIISRVLGLFLFIFVVLLCLLAVITFAAVALIDVLSNYMAVWGASLIVGCGYLLIIVVAVLCRKPLFINPFIKQLTQQIRTEEELELKTLEAENKAEVQRVRIETQVDAATRELDFYLSLLSKGWQFLKNLLRRRR